MEQSSKTLEAFESLVAELRETRAALAQEKRVSEILTSISTCPWDPPYPCEDKPEPTNAECHACCRVWAEAKADKETT